jgi:hypothetical protein
MYADQSFLSVPKSGGLGDENDNEAPILNRVAVGISYVVLQHLIYGSFRLPNIFVCCGCRHFPRVQTELVGRLGTVTTSQLAGKLFMGH